MSCQSKNNISGFKLGKVTKISDVHYYKQETCLLLKQYRMVKNIKDRKWYNKETLTKKKVSIHISWKKEFKLKNQVIGQKENIFPIDKR